MRVLWITNNLFPDVCEALNIPSPVIEGWLYAGAKNLLCFNPGLELGVASLYNGQEYKTVKLNGIQYYLIPKPADYNVAILGDYYKKVAEQFVPDVVHIHGTEFPYGLAYIHACGNKNVVVSIQGLVSVIERYYYGGIPVKELIRNTTLRDVVRRDTIFTQKRQLKKRGAQEIQIIQGVQHVIGRTSWDKAHVWAINSKAVYHRCNETLRDSFYNHTWSYENCEKHSIFLSQGYYPIKGLHKLIEALPLVLKDFPDTKVYVAGVNFLAKKKWLLSGYAKYVQRLIKKYSLEDRIIFAGPLAEEAMCERYLQSNVFVCPSIIENSSNSLGEAQLLGLPSIVAYAGGMPYMIEHKVSGLLYRFEETEMLAYLICRVFSDNELVNTISKNGREEALKRHNDRVNAERLCEIYKLSLKLIVKECFNS